MVDQIRSHDRINPSFRKVCYNGFHPVNEVQEDVLYRLVELVRNQTNCTPAEAFEALKNNNGDVVSAIVEINT